MNISILSVGMNRGVKRVWLQGRMLALAGFSPKTRYSITRNADGILLTKNPLGMRSVCAKTKDGGVPVIDINNGELLAIFDGLEHVKVTFARDEIIIQPVASEQRARERLARAEHLITSGEPLTFGSLAHGIGVLDDALVTGFAREGIASRLKVANEIRSDLTEHAMGLRRTWDAATIGLNGKMQELAFDDAVMRRVGQCDFVSAGLPCSGASVAGRAKRKLMHPEAHPEVGHLVVAFLAIVARWNPLVVVLENVTQYAGSASMEIIRSQMRDLGYELSELVIDGAEWNALEHRKRFVMVGVTKGLQFSMSGFDIPPPCPQTLGDILEAIAPDDPRWRMMDGLKAKQERDAAACKSFAMQVFTETSGKICTLTKGLQRNRSTDAKIQHATNPDLLRIPTPLEHARAKQIPDQMINGLPDTIAHEALGQSVIYSAFVALGRHIARSLKQLAQPKEEPQFELAFS